MKKYLLLLLIFFIIGCSENELTHSIFIPDPDDPDLPIYSEWGYNTFGAYYDREVITSNEIDVPAKAFSQSNVFSFELTGNRGATDYYNTDNSIVIRFTLPDFHPTTYADLVQLNATTFDLASANTKIAITINGVEQNSEVLSGQLQFKRAQSLLVDEELYEVILSGYFDLKVVIDSTPITISDGRFDVGISEVNFYNY